MTEYSLTPEEAEKERKWRETHGAKCQCWKCMWVKMPWVESLDRAQSELETIDDEWEAKWDEHCKRYGHGDNKPLSSTTNTVIEDAEYIDCVKVTYNCPNSDIPGTCECPVYEDTAKTAKYAHAIKDSSSCSFSGPGRGDCMHFVGLPGESIPGQHDGPDDTVDHYGKPNGWCWSCWRSLKITRYERRTSALSRWLKDCTDVLADPKLLEVLVSAKVHGVSYSGKRVKVEEAVKELNKKLEDYGDTL